MRFREDGGCDQEHAEAGDDPHVVLLNPSTAAVSPFPVAYSRFHDDVLVDIKDLGEEHFGGWAAQNPEQVPLAFDECVSNTVPLFAGGADSWDSLAKQDLQVVWGTHSRLLAQLR